MMLRLSDGTLELEIAPRLQFVFQRRQTRNPILNAILGVVDIAFFWFTPVGSRFLPDSIPCSLLFSYIPLRNVCIYAALGSLQ